MAGSSFGQKRINLEVRLLLRRGEFMLSKSVRYMALVPVALCLVVFFQNCGQPGSIAVNSPVPILDDTNEIVPPTQNDPTQPGVPPTDQPPAPVPPPAATPPPAVPPVVADVYVIKVLPSSKFICEPFGNLNGGEIKGGLKAELAYVDPSLNLEASVKNSYGSAEYFSDKAQFLKTPAPIFLSQVNVPTRKFDRGFMLSDGSFLSDTKNNKLIEWFALKMKSQLKLSDTDQEGLYEIATISDDGSRLFMAASAGAEEIEIINNDGAHSTKMKCAANAVSMTKASKLPITYYYNQGPRTEIANVMVWRKKAENAVAGAYEYCGKVDRLKFWNPADSSAAEYWKVIEADGWKIIDAKNFELPGDMVNPCATQNNNLITKAEFTALINGMATLNIDFLVAANIKAKLYKVDGATQTLVQAFDFSAQAKDKISLDIKGLEVGGIYALEVLLEMADKGNQVLNEVRFQIVKQ